MVTCSSPPILWHQPPTEPGSGHQAVVEIIFCAPEAGGALQVPPGICWHKAGSPGRPFLRSSEVPSAGTTPASHLLLRGTCCSQSPCQDIIHVSNHCSFLDASRRPRGARGCKRRQGATFKTTSPLGPCWQ